MDWQPGDEALCVREFGGLSNTGRKCPVPMPTKGTVYHVVEAFLHPWSGGTLTLRFSDLKDLGPGSGWDARKFIKINGLEADAFDREVIEALKSEPVHVDQLEREVDTCHSEVDSCASMKRSESGS